MLLTPNAGTAPRRCGAIQAPLAKIGTRVRVAQADAPTFRRCWLQERQWDMVTLQWVADLDPDETLHPELHSGEAWNAGKAIVEDGPVGVIDHVNEQKVLHRYVKGFQMIPASLINMHTVWLDKA
jgi:peptide/nickel transport system substrate-binding protein